MSKIQWGYCANVHPGTNLEQVKANLQEFSVQVKHSVSPADPMGIGLWLSATALEQLNSNEAIDEFRDWLGERGLVPFTFNGFPFGDFHQDVVKREVYKPTWAENSRLEYTIRLAEIQDRLLPAGVESSISTLPIGWPSTNDEAVIKAAAENLRACATRLDQMRDQSGRVIRVAVEPEPGCLLDTAEDVVGFFSDSLLTGNAATDEVILRHITICHDVCHSAVMFESQQHAIELYRQHGIRIGKVQVSSAVEVDFDSLDDAARAAAFAELQEFNEPKYLHQTSVQMGAEGTERAEGAEGAKRPDFYEDLSTAIQTVKPGTQPEGKWRVHFHVPIFAKSLRAIGTTQEEIIECLKHVGDEVTHFEVETYAWNVLPVSQVADSLADGIAKELKWFREC